MVRSWTELQEHQLHQVSLTQLQHQLSCVAGSCVENLPAAEEPEREPDEGKCDLSVLELFCQLGTFCWESRLSDGLAISTAAKWLSVARWPLTRQASGCCTTGGHRSGTQEFTALYRT